MANGQENKVEGKFIHRGQPAGENSYVHNVEK